MIFKGVSRVFQRSFKKVSKKLLICFKKVSFCMALIAASRAEGGLVLLQVFHHLFPWYNILGLNYCCILFQQSYNSIKCADTRFPPSKQLLQMTFGLILWASLPSHPSWQTSVFFLWLLLGKYQQIQYTLESWNVTAEKQIICFRWEKVKISNSTFPLQNLLTSSSVSWWPSFSFTQTASSSPILSSGTPKAWENIFNSHNI